MKVTKERVLHPDQSFRYLHFSVDAFRGEMHRHPQLELTWVERGSGLRYVADSAVPFRDGDMVLVGANVPHWWVSSHAPRAGKSTATVLQFPASIMSHAAFPELKQLAPVLGQARFGLEITGACRRAIRQVLERMRKADLLGRLAGLLEIFGLLSAHRRSLRRIAGSASPAVELPGDGRRVDRVVDWIHNHLADELRAEHAARIAHVTPAAFSRFFRREVGKTFTRYVNDVRCSEACVRLSQSERPIAVIAGECGFTSIAHFNRQFLARMKTTPREYRRNTASRPQPGAQTR